MTSGGSEKRDLVRDLYAGDSARGRRFRFALLAFDLVTIGFFLVSSFVPHERWIVAVDLVLALALTIEFAARLWIAPRPLAHLASPTSLADLVVIASLVAPAIFDNLAFLRVVRTLRLLRSYRVLADLRKALPWFRANEDVLFSTLNLAVFVFVVTAIVFVTQNDTNPAIETYADALYFTVTTLTTTGFGDITLQGQGGRLLAVAIMIIGVGLFLRLVQAIYRPRKVTFECPDCGLRRHDLDAVHCKHCGRILHIPDEGQD